MKPCFHAAILLLILSALPVLAQTPSTGAQLTGAIMDPSGALVPGASVALRSETTGIKQSTTYDSYGQYRFILVPTGQYTLSVEMPGFSKITNEGVILTVGQVANFPVTLQLAAARAEVTVRSDTDCRTFKPRVAGAMEHRITGFM
jgi:hypothetical protein